jgi:hypothetical protein
VSGFAGGSTGTGSRSSPGRGDVDDARVYDSSLKLRARFAGLYASGAVVSAGRAVGVAGDRLVAASLPSGPARMLRRLPGPVTHVIASVY